MSGHATRPADPRGQAVLERCIQVAVLPIAGKHPSSTSPATSVPMERQDVDITVRKHIKIVFVIIQDICSLNMKNLEFLEIFVSKEIKKFS